MALQRARGTRCWAQPPWHRTRSRYTATSERGGALHAAARAVEIVVLMGMLTCALPVPCLPLQDRAVC
jgi:hypothetical protein